MKIAIVADVHGNLTVIEAVIRDIRHIGADIVINGGDLVEHDGARPVKRPLNPNVPPTATGNRTERIERVCAAAAPRLAANRLSDQ